MRRPPAPGAVLVAALAAALQAATACGERLAPVGGGLGVPAPRQLLVQLTVEPTAATGEYVLRCVTRAGEGAESPAAFRVTLELPAGVAVLEQAPDAGGMLSAVNVVGRTARVAGAAASGAAAGGALFALRVRAPSMDAMDGAALTVDDLASARGADLRGAARVVSRPARVSGGGR